MRASECLLFTRAQAKLRSDMIISPFPVIKQPNPSQNVFVFVPHASALWSPLLIFVLSCGCICCACDVVSLLALVMWLSGFLVTTLLWSGLCLVIRVAMGKEHQENKRAIRNNQQELSEQSAVSMKDPRLTYRNSCRHAIIILQSLN